MKKLLPFALLTAAAALIFVAVVHGHWVAFFGAVGLVLWAFDC